MTEPTDSTQIFGKFFTWFAWVAALVILYAVFNNLLERQQNPNQQVQSYRDGNRAIVVLDQNRQGHYLANGEINQRAVTFLLDTGATQVAIPGRLSDQLGLTRGTAVQVRTANGIALAYQTQLDELRLGEIRLQNVSATIVPDYDSSHILLGMSALRTLEFTQRDRQLTLIQ
ncbi:retropepsin-like aspartic protease family protein [Aliidiomarina celeris]|uniref:retropepsin-like aspartic protease family protein n=1 Tax=Aliidiomarina celeris TaxID=2249428 RepID=UPI000DE94D57|nr:TIGR02281 family clan AA aspartic protease [Aliidiomarina celeris]